MGKQFRGSAITQLANAVAEQHATWTQKSTRATETTALSVDLAMPEFVILCQAFSPLCGISVVEGEEYRQCGKYNLTKLQGVVIPSEDQGGSYDDAAKGGDAKESKKVEVEVAADAAAL